MTRPPEASKSPTTREAVAGEEQLLRRFTVAEFWIHRTTAALMGTAIASAAFLYLPTLGELVGRRHLLVIVHEWSGIALPLPLLAGLLSRAFRADLTRLNRFTPHDRGWLRATLRYRPHLSGKFNAGQKMYAAVAAGAVLVMIGTGLIKWFPKLTPLFARTGATFVHDWLALLLGVLIGGHIWMASHDPEARRGLRTGFVTRSWARQHHALWEKNNPGDHRVDDDHAKDL
ncbi:cytochrome b/b6 domain-containing protein [Streptomyces fagopyri]|uniref:cytochrome b/b6 domain-containing protein n=1 Tax=Streptomyces fagopyri TaxID=2662397 RepID=UPI0036B4EA1B